MKKSYQQCVCLVPLEEPSDKIARRVMERVETSKTFQIRMGAFFYGLLAFVAIISFWPVVTLFMDELTRSDFLAYASLAIYDFSYLSGHWSALASSLGSAFPISASLLILVIMAVLYSVSRLSVFTTEIMIRNSLGRPAEIKWRQVLGLSI